MSGQSKPVGVIGFPFSKGQPRGGTEYGPKVLREGGLVSLLENLGNKVVDHKDVEIPEVDAKHGIKDTLKNGQAVGLANKKLSETVSKLLQADETVLVLGGDHSLGIGSIHGHAQAQPDVVVVWVDAHADINTPLSSPSGNIHGMPLSFIVRDLQSYMPQSPGFEWCKPCLSAKDIVYIGLRDVDPAENLIIKKMGIPSFSMQEVDALGIKEVLDRALSAVDPSGNRPIHVSFDVDAMDPSVAASTGTPVRGGLTIRESFYIAETIAATGRMAVLDIVEVNPLLGTEKEQKLTVENTVDLTTKFYGGHREGNPPPGYVIPKPDAPKKAKDSVSKSFFSCLLTPSSVPFPLWILPKLLADDRRPWLCHGMLKPPPSPSLDFDRNSQGVDDNDDDDDDDDDDNDDERDDDDDDDDYDDDDDDYRTAVYYIIITGCK
ncbi:Arginase [Plakobranchus ocellatus]|uniref:Arginase n=1 Tax=Plakobranchus ocellatus TaxID=259542 RepID=A0AAV4AX22_9GAST|nr:Arginase [Plakobranchus ocellatus]